MEYLENIPGYTSTVPKLFFVAFDLDIFHVTNRPTTKVYMENDARIVLEGEGRVVSIWRGISWKVILGSLREVLPQDREGGGLGLFSLITILHGNFDLFMVLSLLKVSSFPHFNRRFSSIFCFISI